MMSTLTSDDGRITELDILPTHSVFYNVRLSSNSSFLRLQLIQNTIREMGGPGFFFKNHHQIRIQNLASDLYVLMTGLA